MNVWLFCGSGAVYRWLLLATGLAQQQATLPRSLLFLKKFLSK